MDEGEIGASKTVRRAVSRHIAQKLHCKGRPLARAKDDEIAAVLQRSHNKLVQDEDQIALGRDKKEEMIICQHFITVSPLLIRIINSKIKYDQGETL